MITSRVPSSMSVDAEVLRGGAGDAADLLTIPQAAGKLQPSVRVMDPQTIRENSAFLARMEFPQAFERNSKKMVEALEELAEIQSRPMVSRGYSMQRNVPVLPHITEEMKEEYAKQFPEEAKKIAKVEERRRLTTYVGLGGGALGAGVSYVLTRSVLVSLFGVAMIGSACSMLYLHSTDEKDMPTEWDVYTKRDDWWEKEWLYSQDPSLDNRPLGASEQKPDGPSL